MVPDRRPASALPSPKTHQDVPGSSARKKTRSGARSATLPEDGADVAELMRLTGLGRSTIYRYLAQFADQGRAVQVGWGRWRAADQGDGHDE